MPALLYLTLLIAPPTPASIPARATVDFDGSRCLIGFCPAPERGGLPPGVMFLATGLVSIGVHGLVRRKGQLQR